MRREDIEELLVWFFAGIGLHRLIEFLADYLKEKLPGEDSDYNLPRDFPGDDSQK